MAKEDNEGVEKVVVRLIKVERKLPGTRTKTIST